MIADQCSQSERRAAVAERELVEWKKVKFMSGRVGEDFDGLIISTAKYGLFVELADLFVEGLVPIDSLPGDSYTYRENVRKVIGNRTHREFSIGDAVRVVLDRVDGNDRKLQFSILEESRKKDGTKKSEFKRTGEDPKRRVPDGSGKQGGKIAQARETSHRERAWQA